MKKTTVIILIIALISIPLGFLTNIENAKANGVIPPTYSDEIDLIVNSNPEITFSSQVENGSIHYINGILSVHASDIDGSISKVELYNENKLLGYFYHEDENKYSINWIGALPGTYTLKAVVYDNHDFTGSAFISVNYYSFHSYVFIISKDER